MFSDHFLHFLLFYLFSLSILLSFFSLFFAFFHVCDFSSKGVRSVLADYSTFDIHLFFEKKKHPNPPNPVFAFFIFLCFSFFVFFLMFLLFRFFHVSDFFPERGPGGFGRLLESFLSCGSFKSFKSRVGFFLFLCFSFIFLFKKPRTPVGGKITDKKKNVKNEEKNKKSKMKKSKETKTQKKGKKKNQHGILKI